MASLRPLCRGHCTRGQGGQSIGCHLAVSSCGVQLVTQRLQGALSRAAHVASRNFATQQALLQSHRDGCHSLANQDEAMRAYSPDELDVMADAYVLVLETLEGASASPELAQMLVDEIGAGVARGLRDERALAKAALTKARGLRLKSRRQFRRIDRRPEATVPRPPSRSAAASAYRRALRRPDRSSPREADQPEYRGF